MHIVQYISQADILCFCDIYL